MAKIPAYTPTSYRPPKTPRPIAAGPGATYKPAKMPKPLGFEQPSLAPTKEAKRELGRLSRKAGRKADKIDNVGSITALAPPRGKVRSTPLNSPPGKAGTGKSALAKNWK